VHCPVDVHCTHVTETASQYGVVPVHAVGWPYWPFAPHWRTELPLQVSEFGVQAQHAPAPLQVPPLHAVPWVVGVVPHVLATHVAARHGVPVAGQSVGARQATQVPLLGSQWGVAPEHGVWAAY
jgi:hypothetical protein